MNFVVLGVAAFAILAGMLLLRFGRRAKARASRRAILFLVWFPSRLLWLFGFVMVWVALFSPGASVMFVLVRPREEFAVDQAHPQVAEETLGVPAGA